MNATQTSTAVEPARADKDLHAWCHAFPVDLLVITLIAVVSFAVRIAALRYWGTGAIESEGAEYARLAQNLQRGVGYVGIATPGHQLIFPPLFPLLIRGASLITHDYVRAGRLVSLL